MVGTPWKTVHLSRSIVASTTPASKRGTSDIAQPNRTQMLMMLDRPNTWNSSSTVSTTSLGYTPTARAGMSAFM
jgi:hypothetical protein